MEALGAALREAWQALQATRHAHALDACDRALALDPTAFDGWRMRAVACDALGDAPGALQALSRAQALRPQDAACALDLGTAWLRGGDARAARPLLQQASEAMPGDARAAFRLGQACALVADDAAACDAFARAASQSPTWTQAWINLAVVQHRVGQADAALDSARRALATAPEAVEAHRTLAALLSHRFDALSLEAGRAHAAFALARDPDHADAHADVSLIARKRGELDAACVHAARAAALAPAHAGHAELLGETRALAGDAAGAVEAFKQARARGLDTPVLRRQHAIALLQAGDAHAACAALERCVADAPGDQRAIAHLGVALARCGRVDAAIDRLGLDRHVHAVDLPVPAGYPDRAAFHAALAEDVARHSRQRWEPAGLAAHGAFLSGELTDDDTPAIRAFDTALGAVLDAFLARMRLAARDARDDDLFLRNVPAGATRRHAWSTLAPAAGQIGTHLHEDSWLSGAYYVQLPDAVRADDPNRAGWIEFGRPFASLPPVPDALLRHVPPREGLLLLFPSYLFHRTRPFAGAGHRISLSFDLGVA